MRPAFRSRRRPALAGLAALAVLGGVSACGGGAAERAEHPLLLVGVDGLEPGIVDALLAENRLPNLARFAEHGVLGRLETFQPTYSPVVWTTIATGQGYEAHGIDHFAPGENESPYTSNCRKVPALWNLVSDAGRAVDVVGWWVSWPAEVINGRMVSSYAAQAQFQVVWKGGLWRELPEQTWPASLQDRIEPLALWFEDDEELKGEFWRALDRPARPFGGKIEQSVRDMLWTFAGDRSFSSIGEHFLENEPGELVMVYMALPDVAGHHLWRYHQPADFAPYYEVPTAEVEDYGGWLAQTYEEADRRIGRLLERAPAGANVILISDHGMEMETTPALRRDPDEVRSGHHWESPAGVFGALGPLVKRGGNLLADPERGRLGHVLGIAPLVLHMLDLPIPEHWETAPPAVNSLEEILDDTWRAGHRRQKGPNPDPDFRPASAPRVPRPGMDREFLDALGDLGYAAALEELRETED